MNCVILKVGDFSDYELVEQVLNGTILDPSTGL